MMEVFGLFNYWVFAILLMTGLYTVMAKGNLVKKLIGLAMFQSAVFLLYITMDKVEGGTAPIIQNGVPDQLYSNPLPQVLILTAIVVGIATLALGLAIVVRINETYGTIEESETAEMDGASVDRPNVDRAAGRTAMDRPATSRSETHRLEMQQPEKDRPEMRR